MLSRKNPLPRPRRRNPRTPGSGLAALAVLAALLLLFAMPAAADPSDERPEANPPAGPSTDEDGTAGHAGAGGAGAASGAGGGGASHPAKKRRGGVNPCMTPDPGWGKYDPWISVSSGQMIAPHKGGVTKNGGFDLIVHFHGHEPIRKEFVKTANGSVLVGIDLGIGSGAYQSAFANPSLFTNLIASVEGVMTKRAGKPAHVRKIALSSWSAGYGAAEQILRQPAGRKIDAVILLDSLHVGYVDESQKTYKVAQIEPFIEFARRARDRKTLMFMSHSSIVPPGYASTTETAAFVISQLRGKLKKADRQDVLGLDMIDRFDRGNLHVRGYTGDDKPDHCAHIGLMADIVKRHLEPRWKTPSAH